MILLIINMKSPETYPIILIPTGRLRKQNESIVYDPMGIQLSAIKTLLTLIWPFKVVQGQVQGHILNAHIWLYIHAPYNIWCSSIHLATRCTWRIFPIPPHVKQIWLKMAKSSLKFPYKGPVLAKPRNRPFYWSSTQPWEVHGPNLKKSYWTDFEKIAI